MEKLEIIVDESRMSRHIANVKVTPKLHRLLINRTALDIMIQEYGKNFDCTQLLKSPTNPKAFWIKPCSKEDHGSRKLGNGSAKTVGCSLLLKTLNWVDNGSQKFKAVWDADNQAIKVDLDDIL